ncbi:putative alpha-1,6-mannosyltransferase subunit [Talaromyces proteolyticus]|uniref:Alpha-1,6-mannosyltransferase subunit n=1 Tax=Talaromyces proteolyticus TaxID=1131652 RepID=A0AAD4KWN3_9EURO|nr:putative alpha-1,6-mannosyltransferase subunit [Talaromyces proteolyticus]KAH8701829.1 putative alpha-1,6-mannosyltransferase subunit [Talaromyces proteolyticus]
MAPVRRGLVAIVVLLAFVFLLRSSSSASSDSRDTHSSERPVQVPPRVRTHAGRQQSAQFFIEDIADRPLRERLRYQYPYDIDAKFPAFIWQTWKDVPSSSWFPDELRPSEESWSQLHPGFVHEVLGDKTAEHLIRYLYSSVPEVVEAYESLPVPVLKADLFRYLILLARGGVYSDIDTEALQPAIDWLPKDLDPLSVGLVVGIEADPDRPDWHDWYSRRIQFCQWTIQSKPGHPILRDVVATIVEDTLRMKREGILTMARMDKSIVEFTGPAVWTDAVFRYFNNEDYFQNEKSRNVTYEDFTGQTTQKKVGDVVVLPITSFSPGVGQMGAEEPDHPMAFVRHDFGGTWKPANERYIG